MNKLEERIYALNSINELVEHLQDMKKYLHEYDYDCHKYTDILADPNGQRKIEILATIEKLLMGAVADQF